MILTCNKGIFNIFHMLQGLNVAFLCNKIYNNNLNTQPKFIKTNSKYIKRNHSKDIRMIPAVGDSYFLDAFDWISARTTYGIAVGSVQYLFNGQSPNS
jgi:hypothetical protein